MLVGEASSLALQDRVWRCAWRGNSQLELPARYDKTVVAPGEFWLHLRLPSRYGGVGANREGCLPCGAGPQGNAGAGLACLQGR